MKCNRKNRNTQAHPQLELSAMVDVVFLLLIFFVVTLKVEDILAGLNVSAPSATIRTDEPVEMPLLHIYVNENDYVVNGMHLSEESLADGIRKLAAYSRHGQVVIICDSNSFHSRLVSLLDICARENMKNLVLMHQ